MAKIELRALQCPGADQAKHGAVLEPAIIGLLRQGRQAQIIGAREISLVKPFENYLPHPPSSGRPDSKRPEDRRQVNLHS